MAVLRLVTLGNDETVHTLEWMLQEAKHQRLKDLLSAFRDDHGIERQAYTGLYRVDPAKALWTITRMKMALMQP